jgi:hypothetical protein
VAVIALWIGFSSAKRGIFPQAVAQAYAVQMQYFVWVVGLGLMGNGLRTAFMRRHASISYTLTLPVSRDRLISTHFAGNCAAAVIASALTLAAQCATLWLRGAGIPFIPLAMSIAFATLFLIAWSALLSAFTSVIHEGWAIVAAIPLYVFSVPRILVTVIALPARSEFPWISVAALLTTSVLALAFSLGLSRIQEFG